MQDSVFDPLCVSTVAITAPESSLENLRSDPKGEYQPATMVFDLCGQGTTVFGPSNVTFRLKGAGSFRDLDGKAAFKVKMPSGSRIDGLKSLTLNNMVQDETMMHEVLAQRAFQVVGVVAPRVGYATVSINGQDYGLHSNVETPDSRFLAAHYASTQHLYEAPDWTEGHTSLRSRDILPDSVEHFEIDEGSEDSRSDLTALAALTEQPDDAQWWETFQQLYAVEDVLKFWATELFIGQWDGYSRNVNNYHLHSDVAGRFNFQPWGADQALSQDLPLLPQTPQGLVHARCQAHPACATLYRSALGDVAESVLRLDLAGQVHQLQAAIEGAVAADTRKETSSSAQCWQADKNIEFMLDREALWTSEHRSPSDPPPAAAQTTLRLPCPPYLIAPTVVAVGADFADLSLEASARSAPTSIVLRYGTSSNPLDFNQSLAVGSLTGDQISTLQVTVNGLGAATKYHFQVIATNAKGTAVGPVQSFTTEGGELTTPPITTPSVSPLATVVINGGSRFATKRAVTLDLTLPDAVTGVEVSNSAAFEAARRFAPATTLPWKLRSLSARHRDREVHVRFVINGGKSPAIEVADSIFYDDAAPTLRAVRVSAVAASTRSAFRLMVEAGDEGSGLRELQIREPGRVALSKRSFRHPGANTRRFSYSTTAGAVELRVVDRAGNTSGWKTIELRRP